jgi:hypothetical protein
LAVNRPALMILMGIQVDLLPISPMHRCAAMVVDGAAASGDGARLSRTD